MARGTGIRILTEWLRNPGPARATAKRRGEIKLSIWKVFGDSDGGTAAGGALARLLRWGLGCGGELVRALMRELGLVSGQVRRRWSLTGQAAAGTIPDLAARDLTAEKPDAKMVGDITDVFSWEGWR